MNISSDPSSARDGRLPIAVLEYRNVGEDERPLDVGLNEPATGGSSGDGRKRLSLTEVELASKIEAAVAQATLESDEKRRDEHEQQIRAERERLAEVIKSFERERAEYYAAVEPELVHLILSVAAKILHREAQVDRMLVAALAKIAVENLQQRSHVVLRVAPAACPTWREYFSLSLTGTKVEVLEDSQLLPDGCVLETELGAADIGLEAQLKEIERGFFDLLAKRPETR